MHFSEHHAGCPWQASIKGQQLYTERKKKRRVNFIPKFHSSLKKFVKYFTMITKRYMYGTKVPNFIGMWSTSFELLKFIGSYPPNLEIKIKLKINIGCAPPLAAVAALILLWIELTKALTVCIEMLFHSSINAFLSCARVAGRFRCFLTLLSSSSHMCSIGVKSGLYGGHASGVMLLFARKSWQTWATWSGIVLLQNQITLLHKGNCNKTQDLIPIPYCGHIAHNNNQLWFYPVSNASPDHNGATPKPIPFDFTGVGKAFFATLVHTTSTICAIESEPRLIRKKNSSPLPHRK